MSYGEEILVCISDSTIQLLLPPLLQNMTQRHKIKCCCKIRTKAGAYQEYLNYWHKRRLQFINNSEK